MQRLIINAQMGCFRNLNVQIIMGLKHWNWRGYANKGIIIHQYQYLVFFACITPSFFV
jgi:hypothetical protein